VPKIKNLAHCLRGRITWYLTSREDIVLRVIENNMLTRDLEMRESGRQEDTIGWGTLSNLELSNF
jgi:hypothetical protein